MQTEFTPFEMNMLAQLARIADSLEVLARPGKDYAPDNTRPIEDFAGFDWSSINATVVRTDAFGPSHVEWGGHVYTRRSPSNRFDPAVWYSRATGKDEEGDKTVYARLITFKEIKDADPLSDKAADLIENSARRQAANSTRAQAGGQPAGSANPGKTTPEPVSLAKYIANANRLGISENSAKWLAQQCKITDPTADYSKPNGMLERVVELRKTFTTQATLLQELTRLKLV